MPFTDPGAERAIVGCIVAGTFSDIPAELHIPCEAFSDPVARIVYSAAVAVGYEGSCAHVLSVNEWLTRTGCFSEIQKALHPASWEAWSQDADLSYASMPRGVLKDCFDRILSCHHERLGEALRKQFGAGEISKEQLDSQWDKIQTATHGSNGKLTMRTISQILEFQDDPTDILLSNGYIEKGAAFVFCGQAGIGKSRLALQLAIKSVLGDGFLGWETNASGMRWAFLQNENGNRRLKADLLFMVKDLTAVQRKMLDECILIHCIVTDTDGHLDLSDPDASRHVREVVQDWKPDIVIGDPLTAFGSGDLNTDKDMLFTAKTFGRIVQENDPRRTPGLMHHSRTGKEAVAGVSGADRAAFGRNSKALYAWTRSQFNLAPAEEDQNDKLILASGKCNNFKEFAPFIIGLETTTMFYSKTAEDVATAKDRMSGKFRQTLDRKMIAKLLSKTVPRQRVDVLRECLDKKLMSERSFDTYWKQLVKLNEITEQGDKWSLV